MTLEVALTIDPAVVGPDESAAVVAERLVQLGGRMIAWQPGQNGAPAQATFQFKNPVRLKHFVTDALAVPGVSLATR